MFSPLESSVQALFKITKPVSSSGWLTVSEWHRAGTAGAEKVGWDSHHGGHGLQHSRAPQVRSDFSWHGGKDECRRGAKGPDEGCAAMWLWQVPREMRALPCATQAVTEAQYSLVPPTSVRLWANRDDATSAQRCNIRGSCADSHFNPYSNYIC